MNNDLSKCYYQFFQVKLVPCGKDENGQTLYDVYTVEGDILLAKNSKPTSYMAAFMKDETPEKDGRYLGSVFYDKDGNIALWDVKREMIV